MTPQEGQRERSRSATKYPESYYDQYLLGSRFRRYLRRLLAGYLTPRAEALFQVIRDLPDNAVVVDVGAGAGGLLQIIEWMKPSVRTVAVDPNLPTRFLARADRIVADGVALPLKDGACDVLLCSHVIEHLEDPLALIRELHRVCASGGMVYVESPSQRSDWPIVGTFRSDPTHLRPYKPVQIGALLSAAGFRQLAIGVKRSWLTVLLTLPLLVFAPFGAFTAERRLFWIYLIGFNAYALGSKSESFCECGQ